MVKRKKCILILFVTGMCPLIEAVIRVMCSVQQLKPGNNSAADCKKPLMPKHYSSEVYTTTANRN